MPGNLGTGDRELYEFLSGVDLLIRGMFDVNPASGRPGESAAVEIRCVDDLATFIRDNDSAEIASADDSEVERRRRLRTGLIKAGIKAIWNFAHTDYW